MQSTVNQRQHMVLGQLITNDILDKTLLEALTAIPREPFLPEHLRGAAYVDEDLDAGNGRWLLAPLTFARLLAMAEITPACRVLDIGCLSGYSTAVLAKLTTHVTGIDTDAGSIARAQAHMQRLGIANTDIRQVPSLDAGHAPGAPYDVIILEGAVTFIPEALGVQLAIGGRLVAVRNRSVRPGAKGGLGKGLLVRRLDSKLQYREHFDASTAILPGFERGTGFSF